MTTAKVYMSWKFRLHKKGECYKSAKNDTIRLLIYSLITPASRVEDVLSISQST